MGVRGLFSYADREGLFQEVDIQEIADEYRRTNGGEPVIAVDGSSFARRVYDAADWLCGGQYKHLRDACSTYVQRFRNSGVQPVIFFDGLPVEEKMQTWLQRRNERTQKICEMFYGIRSGHFQAEASGGLICIPEGVVPTSRVILKVDLACEVHVSTGDCDRELAEYAAASECCLGVLTGDSDFLVHEGVPCVFKMDSLKLEESPPRLRVRRYEPARIASGLGLEVDSLPLLASLVGNDIVTADLRGKGWRPLQKIAGTIANGPRDLPALCRAHFGNKWRAAVSAVRESIQSYRRGSTTPSDSQAEPETDAAWVDLLREAEERHVTGQAPAVVYAVIKCGRFRIAEALEDLSMNRYDMPPSGLALRPMRARMYGVLLRERSSEVPWVTELVPTEVGEMHKKVVPAEALPTGVQHPGLRALWSVERTDARTVDSRWRLFAWVVSPRADVAVLRALAPRHLLVPATALSFLRHEADVLRPDETRVFAIVAVTVSSQSTGQLSSYDDKRSDERAIYLATLFVRTVLHVLDAAGACGLSLSNEMDCQLHAYFDGRYFRHVYLTSKSGANLENSFLRSNSLKEQFQQLMDFIERAM